MADEALAAFMDVSGCGYDDAFHRLASCGGHLGRAASRFFNVDAGPSGTRRSPAPQQQEEVSDTEDDDDDPGRAAGRSPSCSSPRAVSVSKRRDGEARGGGGSRSSRRSRRRRDREAGGGERRRGEKKRRRVREDDGPSRGGREAGGSRKSSRRRRRSADSSDSEEKAEANSRSRRRLNPKDPASDKDGSNNPGPRFCETISSSSDNGMVVYEARPPPPNSRTVEGLFKVPHELTYKGGFYDAKAHAARRARWLLVNVQQSLEFPSFVQNCDVWASDMVARCVRDHFVLWQADADARGGEREEAEKVLGYYKIPRDRLPVVVVVVVDPVTGQAVDRLHGTDPNDFLVSMGPYTDKNPTLPVVRAKKQPGAQSNQKPATTTAPTTSRQEQAPTVRKPAETAVAMAPTGQARREQALAVNNGVGGEGLQAEGPAAGRPGGCQGVWEPMRGGGALGVLPVGAGRSRREAVPAAALRWRREGGNR
ncbi:putative plant UBX domain-containing protein 14 [Panicum miliaceum]|uniref:Plant UBX domain-containing protein 14 n=1 Tax=Panicum miliaceum TaxID=4540 RepID=A0A3L6T423_PANMI|nr:putative plant UBX domain-containing protein 14 [Panicum miliaceum]